MKELLQRAKWKVMSLMGKMDDYQEEITFAEAGAPKMVYDTSQEKEADEIGKLLVVGSESSFSRDVIEYAVDMARRLSYEIIALNAAPISNKVMKMAPAAFSEACRNFKAQAEEGVRAFKNAAEAAGIKLTHVVHFSEIDDAIRAVNEEVGGIDFVISEPEEERISSRPAVENRLKNEIHVYSMM